MNQVLPYPLWLGHARESQEYAKVFAAGIRAVVELAAEEPPSHPPRELAYCRFPLVDGSDNDAAWIALAIRTVVRLLEGDIPTLVCCGAGMSRSPAIAAASLAWVNKEAPEESLRHVAEHHPTDVSPGFWHEVVAAVSILRLPIP